MGNEGKNRREYENRVNRVIDHIQAHRAEPMTLEQLAQVAAFSPFHFHRIFKSITGENLGEFIQRVRLEWAGTALVQRPGAEVIEIALDGGFQSASAFARAFKEHFGMTATEWRSGGFLRWSKARTADRKPGQALRKAGQAGEGGEGQPGLHDGDDGSPCEPEESTMNVTVRTLPRHRLAYLRNVGPYGAGSGVPELWMRLMRWAAPRDLWTPDRLCLGVAHDDPHVTAPERCRYDAAIVIPADLKVDAQVNVVEFGGGKYALAPFEGTAHEIAACWDELFGRWLPRSGYQPEGSGCVELYAGEAFDAATGLVRCELGLAVKPL